MVTQISPFFFYQFKRHPLYIIS